MAYTEKVLIDELTIDEWGNIGVRESTRVYRDADLVSNEYHRHVVAFGSDVSAEDERVQAMAGAMWAFTWEPAPSEA